MKTVKEVSRLTGLSVRALHHYDAIGLLRPSRTTPAGYRLYDDAALERLQMILLFRELEFPLEQIRQMLDAPGFDRRLALMQQLELLEMKRERLTALIDLTRGLQSIGGNNMDFSAFDRSRLDEYAARAREAWGDTPAFSEYEQKRAGMSDVQAAGVDAVIAKSFARIFYRNSINTGLAIMECSEAVDAIKQGDVVDVDADAGVITNTTTGETFEAQPFPPFIREIIEEGGLINRTKKVLGK